jgi:hypothetical protein
MSREIEVKKSVHGRVRVEGRCHVARERHHHGQQRQADIEGHRQALPDLRLSLPLVRVDELRAVGVSSGNAVSDISPPADVDATARYGLPLPGAASACAVAERSPSAITEVTRRLASPTPSRSSSAAPPTLARHRLLLTSPAYRVGVSSWAATP